MLVDDHTASEQVTVAEAASAIRPVEVKARAKVALVPAADATSIVRTFAIGVSGRNCHSIAGITPHGIPDNGFADRAVSSIAIGAIRGRAGENRTNGGRTSNGWAGDVRAIPRITDYVCADSHLVLREDSVANEG
jgi:hypothetical protein